MVAIGVLALQGDFAEHVAVFEHLGANTREVRSPSDLEQLSGLIIPGGESTTISALLERWELTAPIISLARGGMPVWGTCAGLILMARSIGSDTTPRLGLLDADVLRNGYGRQRDSFEAEVAIPAIGAPTFRAIFIRAPIIQRVGPETKVLASLEDGTPVAVQQGNLLGSSFHPELTADTRFHAYMLRIVAAHRKARHVAPV